MHLAFRKNDLILRQGAYHASVFIVTEGKVRLYTETMDEENTLDILGPGELFGESCFVKNTTEPMPYSARAIEDTEVEAWHPAAIAGLKEVLPFFAGITHQSLKRLDLTRRFVEDLDRKKQARKTGIKEVEWAKQRRRYYRKQVALAARLAPADAPQSTPANSRIIDISRGGAAAEIPTMAMMDRSLNVGTRVQVETTLPGGNPFSATAEIVSSRRAENTGMMLLGLMFTDVSFAHQKNLGFFLMP